MKPSPLLGTATLLVSLFACTLFVYTSALAAATHYFVKKGDTLSQISADHIGHPIYGKNGSLEKAIENNPIIKDPDKIYVGDELLLTSEGILVKRLATPEQIAHAEAVDEVAEKPTPAPTAAPVPQESVAIAEVIPTEVPKPHGTLALRGSVGAAFYKTVQTGALGNYSQDGVNLVESGNFLATFGEGRAEFEYQRLGANFGGESKQLQNFLVKGGYKFIVIGFDEGTSPIASTIVSQTGVVTSWQDLTVISPLLGVHFEWGFEKDAPKTYRESVDLEGELPAWSEKDSTSSLLTATSVSGAEGRLRARIEKSIYSHEKFNLYLGMEGLAIYQSLHFNGTVGATSGQVTRDLQLYQAMLTLNAEL